ncbi:MAG: MBL fold metallo-hydrolase [Sphingobium sp.]|nr:MBL fold metallo-hydrolase [Sphingobium sp.]MBP6112361.1 MBL fold metallo-hydrolase [Sphingobium sp.]MBP8671822.1 MBL fold metallo-hydrolase [Sphingobium sp.]MBP9156157.1 MBL fold metallo-hydrolase [Sphingobium sp.]MCC6481283.1 MBL fold metallo-hydrolase [Sphingomonadaceae bacterium]
MTLRFTILGCGTSAGVPRIGNDWGECDPANPKNRRTRVSLLVQSKTTTLLVDTSPDMREQLLAAGVISIDAVLWTHDHADHCHGIDDLRQVYHHRAHMGRYNEPIDGYARAPALKVLQQRFAYAFEGREGYRAIVNGRELPDELLIGDIHVRCVDMPHGAIWSTGFRFEHGGSSVGYATDFHEMTDAMATLFTGLDVWIVDALREKPHPTHPHLALTMAAITQTAPHCAYLTHMDNSMDYDRLCALLPSHIRPAYDGLCEQI